MAPLLGGLVADAAHLRAGVQWHCQQRQPDEVDPGGERLLAALQHGPREGAEPRTAARAAPAPDAGIGRAVPPRRGLPARGARGARPVELGRLCQDAGAGLLEEHAFADGVMQRLGHLLAGLPIRPNAHPEGMSPNKDPGGRSGKFYVWLGRGCHGRAGVITRLVDC